VLARSRRNDPLALKLARFKTVICSCGDSDLDLIRLQAPEQMRAIKSSTGRALISWHKRRRGLSLSARQQ